MRILITSGEYEGVLNEVGDLFFPLRSRSHEVVGEKHMSR